MRNTLNAAGMGPALLPLALGLALAGGATIASAQSITLNFDTSCPNPTAQGSGPNILISCGGTSGAPTAVPVCSPTASATQVTPGQSVTLRANCTQSPTSYMWTGGLASNNANPTINPQATADYTVTASNALGSSTAKTVRVTVSDNPPPAPGDGSIPAACGATKVVSMGSLKMDGSRVASSGFGGDVIAMSTFVVPAGLSSSKSTISIYEYGGGITARKAWLSQTPCDMSARLGSPFYIENSAPNFAYAIGSDLGNVRFEAGQRWYLMVKNEKPRSTDSSCSGTCNIAIKIYPPN